MSGDSSGSEGGLQIDVGPAEKEEPVVTKGRKAVVWNPGDLVWAKVLGFNFWPAKVLDPDDAIIPKWLKDPPKPTYVLARFFGTYDIQWVSAHTTQSYENGVKKKLQTKSKSRAFLKAMNEVKDFLGKGVVPEGMTSPPLDQGKPDAEKGGSRGSSEEIDGSGGVTAETSRASKRKNSGKKSESGSNKKARLSPTDKKKGEQEALSLNPVEKKRTGRRRRNDTREDMSPSGSKEGNATS